LELQQQASATPASTDIQPFLGRGLNGTLPSCPSDSSQTYAASYSTTIGNCSTAPTCNILSSTHYLN
jgi:hypothetical protein